MLLSRGDRYYHAQISSAGKLEVASEVTGWRLAPLVVGLEHGWRVRAATPHELRMIRLSGYRLDADAYPQLVAWMTRPVR